MLHKIAVAAAAVLALASAQAWAQTASPPPGPLGILNCDNGSLQLPVYGFNFGISGQQQTSGVIGTVTIETSITSLIAVVSPEVAGKRYSKCSFTSSIPVSVTNVMISNLQGSADYGQHKNSGTAYLGVQFSYERIEIGLTEGPGILSSAPVTGWNSGG